MEPESCSVHEQPAAEGEAATLHPPDRFAALTEWLAAGNELPRQVFVTSAGKVLVAPPGMTLSEEELLVFADYLTAGRALRFAYAGLAAGQDWQTLSTFTAAQIGPPFLEYSRILAELEPAERPVLAFLEQGAPFDGAAFVRSTELMYQATEALGRMKALTKCSGP
jgi:hypothetical protein